tara:strand:- start:2182 stop:2757 length:576 start_codon:yes stop_codon:yes gene_type:complete
MVKKTTTIFLIFLCILNMGCAVSFKRPVKHKLSTPAAKSYNRHYMSSTLPPPPELESDEVSVGKAISILKKGQTAPFTGVLLSPDATAELITTLESYDSECQLKIDKELQLQKATHDLKYEQLEITHNTYKSNCEIKLSSRDDTIKVLNATLEKHTNPKTEWWFIGGLTGGFLVGVSITIATVYATSSAFK